MGLDKTARDALSNAFTAVKDFKAQHTKAFWGIIIVLALVLCGTISSCTNTSETSTSLPNTGGDSAQEQVADTGVLSFSLESAEWNTNVDESIALRLEGDTADGDRISKFCQAVPSQTYEFDVPAGTYMLSLVTGHPAKGSNIYQCDQKEIQFDGEHDQHVVLTLKLDSAAMAAAQADREEKAAAQAAQAAQREAEERAAAEQAAAQVQATQSAQASQNQHQSQQSAASQQGGTQAAPSQPPVQNQSVVYVAASGKGKKYHTSPSCSNMKGTISMSVSQAQAQGYTPCKKCA